jgi:hypothetical protein
MPPPYLNIRLFVRYMSDGELLDHGSAVDPGVGAATATGNVGMSSGHLADSPHRSYFIWKEPPRPGQPQGKSLRKNSRLLHYWTQILTGYELYNMDPNSPVRHSSYASQVNYYLQQSQQPPVSLVPEIIVVDSGSPLTLVWYLVTESLGLHSLPFYAQALQSGGPRTTPSGYPGGPIVPSGNLSPPGHFPPSHVHLQHQHPGYATTGRISHHQVNT